MNLFIKIFKKSFGLLTSRIIFPPVNMLYELFHNDYIILTASVNPMHHNWGDDISIILARLISPNTKFIINRYSWNIKGKDNYLCIGSIITWMTTSRSIIWGSGIVYPDQAIKEKPKNVLAVRGPLTRNYLLNYGVNCPEIYGDPALLFPKYYKPTVNKKYKLGIIPHFRDKNNKFLEKYKNNNDVLIIDVTNIKPWSKFIDDINSCQNIVSSSLHGIIISDAYGIPNTWIEFDAGESKRFAFQDYLLSVNKHIDTPFIINNNIDVDDLMEECKKWTEPKIDLDLLLSVCPFKTVKKHETII